MSEHMKTLHTSERISVTVHGKTPQEFTIARSNKNKLLALLRSLAAHDSEELIPADEVFKEIDKKYGKVGATIRGMRLMEGLTQKELARKLGIHQVHISQMEHGKRTVGKNLARKLAKVFNTSYRLFL